MKPRPPHLPKQEETSPRQTQRHSVFYFLSCAFIAIAASLSTVFVALSWIVPRAVPQVQFYNFSHDNPTPNTDVDSDVISRIGDREAFLFDKRTELPGGWYKEGSALSTGVFLTSDGWSVFPLSTSTFFEKTNLSVFQVVDNRGVIYTLDQVVVDKTFHLVYAKVNGSGFRFVSFPSWSIFKDNLRVITQRETSYTFDTLVPSQENFDSSANTEMWKPHSYLLLQKNNHGIIFTEQGELLGVSKQGSIIPGWYIETALVSLLSKHNLSYSAFPWKGEIVDRGFQNGFLKNITGFYITDLVSDKTKNILKIGDVVTKIQGQEFTAFTLPLVLLKSPETVNLEIIRDGQIVQKTLPKQIISF